MPHVTGHFCVCHVELWLLFHDFYPCTQCTQYPVPCHDFFRDKKFGFLDKPGTWVPGYLGKHVRFCSRKHVHFFAITRILFVYVLSQIEKKSIRVIAIYPFFFFFFERQSREPAFPYTKSLESQNGSWGGEKKKEKKETVEKMQTPRHIGRTVNNEGVNNKKHKRTIRFRTKNTHRGDNGPEAFKTETNKKRTNMIKMEGHHQHLRKQKKSWARCT